MRRRSWIVKRGNSLECALISSMQWGHTEEWKERSFFNSRKADDFAGSECCFNASEAAYYFFEGFFSWRFHGSQGDLGD